MEDYPRDLAGYGATPPHAAWPGGARIAIQCVLNYEEGAEANVLDGDPASETFLSDMINPAPVIGARHMSMEQIYEYGSRAGVWRLLRLFERYDLPLTVFGVALAMQRNPAVVDAFLDAGHEIASHGWRWINYQIGARSRGARRHGARDRGAHAADRRAPARLVHRADQPQHAAARRGGRRVPLRRRRLFGRPAVLDESRGRREQLIVPYSLETNDMRFSGTGLNTGEQFESYLRDTFDTLYAEGEERPRMMSVGLHCRLAGRPGKIAGLERFLRYALGHQDVWFCRRIDIARHWRATHPHAA